MQASVMTVVEEVWSPSEILDCAATKQDELAPVSAPFAVPTAKRYAFRTSLATASFESLHHLWDLDRTALTSSELLEKSDLTACVMSWDQLAESERVANSVPDRNRHGWLRFTCVFPTAVFAVNRSEEQLVCLLQALQYSFPQLIVPCCDGQATLAAAVALCRFVQQHHRELSAYVPLLLFLFERDERMASNLLAQADTNLKSRLSQTEKSLRAFKPKTSKGWFSWGSSSSRKKDEPEWSLADQFSFMSQHSSELPPSFKELYVLTFSKCEQLTSWRDAAQKLRETWNERDEAFGSFVKALPVVAPPYETGSHTHVPFTGRDDGDEVKRSSLMLRQFMQNVAIVSHQNVPPASHSFMAAVNVSVLLAQSKKRFLEKILQDTQMIVENRCFVTGKTKPPKEAPSYDNAAVFATSVNAFTELQNRLRRCALTLTMECDWINNEVRRAEKDACNALADVLHSEVASFDAESHFKRSQPVDAETAGVTSTTPPIHPLLVCLGVPSAGLDRDEL